MTSRNAQKLQYSDAVNVDNAMINHKHHRHHDSPGLYPTEVEYNPDKPLQQLPVKHKHRHEHKVNVDGPYDVQNHPIQSISGLLRTERHHGRKSKMYSSGDPKQYSNALMNMNHFCENCHLPKLSESGENSKNITPDEVSKYKDAQKFFNTKSSTSKHVQTSKTKLKQKRIRGDEVKHYHSKSTISRNVIGKSKKEIYIITGEDTLFKFTTLSQEQVHSKHKRHIDRKGLLPIETKLEGDTSINCNEKPGNELTSQHSLVGRSHSSSEFLKTCEAKDLVSKDKNLSSQNKSPAIEEKNRQGDEGHFKDRENYQSGKSEITGAQEMTRHVYGKYRERHSNQQAVESKRRKDKYDYPKVVSTKLKHRQKKSDVTLTDRTKSSEERFQKRHKREHRHRHKNNDLSLPLANTCTESNEKLGASKDIASLLNKPNPDLSNDELEFRRKRILDNIEKAYSKHKHILPKEVVDALDGNIKQWRNMDLEASKKSSDQMSNVLDLEEVLKKNKKSKLHFKEHHSEKITTTASESTLPSGLKKTFKPQNDLILLNAIVTGINNIDCDKETVHVNKIPKFVRLEEIVCEPDTMPSKRVLSKISVMQKCVSEPKDPLDNYSHGAIPKTSRALATPTTSNEDLRKEISFSQLNVQPTISLYSLNNQKLNYLNGFLPTLLGDKKFSKFKKKKAPTEKDLLNLFMKKDGREHKMLSKISIDPVVKFANEDSIFNVDGVEPPKKRKPNIPSVFIPRKNTPDMKKLELVVLPVLEISCRFDKPQTFNDAALSTSALKLFKNPDPYLRKKEHHRIQKTPGLSASSSESTVQLLNLPNGPVKSQLISEKSKRESELKKHYMSDKEAIEALKYLPLHQKECGESSSRSLSKKKLQKIILSTVEIKSEIPAEKVRSSLIINRKKSLDRRASKELNRLESKARTLIPSKETEILLKSDQDSKVRLVESHSDRMDNAIAPLTNLLNEKSLEDYVSKDKYEEKKYDKKGNIIPCLNLNVCKKSNHSICSTIDDKSQTKKPIKTYNIDSGRVRTRMLNYSRNVEQRRKCSRGSTGSSRDTSNEGDNNSGQHTLTTAYPNVANTEEKIKKRLPSLCVNSTSSDVSLNSESDKLSKRKDETKNEAKAGKAIKTSAFPTPNESVDKVNPASEAISAALTKITEETISQDTLNGSDLSHYSKKENESKLPRAKVKPDIPTVKDKNVKPNATPVRKSDTSSTKSGRIPRHVDSSLSSTVKLKRDGSIDRKGAETQDKKGASSLDSKVLNTNAPPPHLKTEELSLLTESVKKIINEMQAINTTNIQTMMQLIMNKKEETNRSSVEEIIARNLENVLRKNALGDQVGDVQNNMEKLRVLTNDNVSGDCNLGSAIKPPGDVSDCGSTKSSRSRKSDRTSYSIRSAKILENKNFGFRKRKTCSALKVPSVRGCSTESQKSDNTQSNAPSSSGEKNLSSLLKPKTKYVSKLARSIPRSVVDKESVSGGKPVSAPSGFDRNKTNQKYNNISPSMDSDTRTSLISTRIGSAKEGSRQMFTSGKPSTTLSKFEKRKQYGESLRKKIKNENVVPAIHDCIYDAAGSSLADGDNVVNDPVEEKPFSQENTPTCNYPIPSSLSDVQDFIGNNVNVACAPIEIEVDQQSVPSQSVPKMSNEDVSVVDIGLSVPTFIKSVKSQTWLNKQSPNVVDGTSPKETDNIYQTFTVMADHPHIIDVFRNKFRKSTFVCASDKESFYSPLSRLSINAYEKTACSRHSNRFLGLKKSENSFQPLEKVKSLMSYSKEFKPFEKVNDKKSTEDKKKSELALSYEFCNSSPEIIYSTKSNSIDHSLTRLNKLSRMKINILEACQHLCKNDEGKQKYILYSPYTCSIKNTRLAEKDYSLPAFHKVDVDNNLHRCKHKFNIHSMLKINRTVDDCCKWYCEPRGFGSDQAGTTPKHINNINSASKITNGKRNLPVRVSRFGHRSDHNTQGNYVVFKIDKKLQLRQQNDTSPKDTSRECFKIFMNNNLHNMQWDSDYPLRFSNYDFKSKFFYHNNYYVNQHPLSENGESGYDSSDGKESRNLLRSLSDSIDTTVSKNSYSTVITFPFNLNQPINQKHTNSSKILSAERDNEAVDNVNNATSSSLPKSRIEQLCESVTNLYNSIDADSARGYRRVNFTSSPQYGTNTTAYFCDKDEKSKREQEIYPHRCNKAHCSRNQKSVSAHRPECPRKTAETNTEVTEKCKASNVNSKNTQTTVVKRQGSSEYKKNCRKTKAQTDDSTDYDVSKNYDNKLIQTNIKRKHKKVTPELTSRSTSYDSITAKEKVPVTESQLVNTTELINMLLSNPGFVDLVAATIKNILVDTHVLPMHSSEQFVKSFVQESISSVAKEKDRFSQQPSSTAGRSNASQKPSNKDSVIQKFSIEVIEKNAKDLQLELTTKFSLQNNDSFIFEEFIIDLLCNIIKRIVDVKQSFKLLVEHESRSAFNKTEETKSSAFKIEVSSANLPPEISANNAAPQIGKLSDHNKNNLFRIIENTLCPNENSYETEKMSTSDNQKISALNSSGRAPKLQNDTVCSHVSSSSGKKQLSVEEKESLVNDLKSFKNVLTDLSCAISETESEEQVLEYCSLKSSKWKLIHKTTIKPCEKASASTANEKKCCKCSTSRELESNDLLKMMSKLPLSTLIGLYKKVSDGNNPEVTFESLIQELYETESNELKKAIEDKDVVVEKIKKNDVSSDDSIITVTKIKELNQRQKQEKIQLTSAPEQSNKKAEMQFGNVRIITTPSTQKLDNAKLRERGKLSHDNIKKIPKQENSDKDGKNRKLPESASSELSRKKPKKLSDEDKKAALNEVVLTLTDKQIFKKLLDSYEKEEKLVRQLSSDDEFLKSQLETVKNKESVEKFLKQPSVPENKSFENVVKELENILEETDSSIKINKPEINAVKKVPSRFFSIKTKMSRLFKSNSRELRETVTSHSSHQHSSMDEFVGKNGKIQFSKTKILERFKREETSLSSSDSDFVKPQEVGKYFMRGFREDQMLLDGATSSKVKDKKFTRDNTSLESFIELSERDNALDYLLALGYSIEEASRAIQDEDVENRLNAAVVEARVWVNQVTKTQGTLLYVLAYKAKPKIMRYYLQLIEAIINNRINNVVKLDSFLKILEKVEDGDISMLYILGSDIFQEEENEEYLLKKQLRKVFHDVYHIAENEARLRGKELTKNEINLLKLLSAKYRSGLPAHLEIIARYIGRGLLHSQVQLEAAMIYFSRLDSSEFHVARFERYCGIKSKE